MELGLAKKWKESLCRWAEAEWAGDNERTPAAVTGDRVLQAL